MDRGMRKIGDVDKESEFGYVYAVSGPGMYSITSYNFFNIKFIKNMRCMPS